MSTLVEELGRIEGNLKALHAQCNTPEIENSLAKLTAVIERAHRAFSGSWFGYHSKVYYANLDAPPPGARFDPQWGLQDRYSNNTVGDWSEVDGEQLYDFLKSVAEEPSLDNLSDLANTTIQAINDNREEVLSVIESCLAKSSDAYLEKLKKAAENAKFISVETYLKQHRPSGQFLSNDNVAILSGVQIPPHFHLLAQVEALKNTFDIPLRLSKTTARVVSHLSNKERAKGIASKQGNKAFLGHGGSAAWREVKDFIEDRLELETDEFNRVPVAGVTNIARLSEMLNDASIAFLIMAAEDETKDGKRHARMNVIHEAGLFQGRLGFSRAIVLLEDGCEEFSNIQGLGQIRFPPGKVKAAFEEIRQVLAREGLIDD